MPGAGWDFRIAYQVAEVGQPAWDELSGGRPFASYCWYAFGEKALPDYRPMYIIVSYQGRDVARATFWLVRQEPLPVYSPTLRWGIDRFLRTWPILTCRSPISETSGLILPPAPLREQALDIIYNAARKLAASARVSFVLFDYLLVEEASRADWPDRFTKVTIGEMGTQLPIRWQTFDDYVLDLSKSSRKDYRRHRNHAEQLNLKISASPQLSRIDEALPLIHAVENHHRAAHKPWVETLLANAHMTPSTWITAEIDGRLVGCGLLLSDGGAQMTTLLGLDYGTPYVYFQVVYAAIQQAIEQKMNVLRAGTGAYELKQRLGFQNEANGCLRLAGQTRFLHWFASLAKDKP